MTGDPFEPVTIAEIRKNARETIIVKLDQFKGSLILHAWTWYLAPDGRWKAGRNGLALSLHHLPALADALQRAVATALERGHLPPA